MEEQVELARQISHSLSADTNSLSKGQSMYVKRRNRSSKWIHQAGEEKEEGKESIDEDSRMSFEIPNMGAQEIQYRAKSPLKLLMNPKGQMWDLNALRHSGIHIDAPPLSPEICSSLVKDLHTPKGKGAALFAKRKQKSEKWVVDENSYKQKTAAAAAAAAAAATPSAPPPSEVTPLPAVATPNRHVEQNQKIASVQERFGGPRYKLLKSPWEAALEDGNVDAAFQDLWPGRPISSGPQADGQTPVPSQLPTVNGIQPKLNMKPLDTVPKLLPSFKAQPQNLLAEEPKVTVVEEEKPFVPAPLRPSNVDLYKPTPKGWGNASLCNEWMQNEFNMNEPKKEPVQPEIDITLPVLVEEEPPQIIYQPNHDMPEIKPLPFEVPVLRSITPAQKQEPEKQELVLPVLKPVPEKPIAVVSQQKPEPEKPELVLPVLKPVPEKPTAVDGPPSSAVNQPPVHWQVRPLDSRPNLQALLEREQTSERSSRQTTPPPSAASTPMDTPRLSRSFPTQVTKRMSTASEDDGLRVMYEAQVTHMSVRNKVQRFEASHGSSTPRSSGSGVHTPPFKQPKQQQPQRILKENAVPAFLIREKPDAAGKTVETTKAIKTPSFPVQQKAAAAPVQPTAVRNSQSFSSFPTVQMRPKTSAKLFAADGESEMNRRSLADYTNYNTAPRGWTAAKDIYRPVTFKMG